MIILAITEAVQGATILKDNGPDGPAVFFLMTLFFVKKDRLDTVQGFIILVFPVFLHLFFCIK